MWHIGEHTENQKLEEQQGLGEKTTFSLAHRWLFVQFLWCIIQFRNNTRITLVGLETEGTIKNIHEHIDSHNSSDRERARAPKLIRNRTQPSQRQYILSPLLGIYGVLCLGVVVAVFFYLFHFISTWKDMWARALPSTENFEILQQQQKHIKTQI